MNDTSIRNLAAATMLQAAREYLGLVPTPESPEAILRSLRSPWMDSFSDGMSIVVAEQLENHPDEIRQRLRREELENEKV